MARLFKHRSSVIPHGAAPEYKPKWYKKQVRILGRSFSVATLLAFFLFTIVFAWGAYLAIISYIDSTANVKVAPIPLDATFNNFDCSMQVGSGSGSAQPFNWDDPSKTLTCVFDDIDETSMMRARYRITNNSSVPITVTITLPTDPCFVYTELNPGVLAPAGDSYYGMLADGIAGPSGTLLCAGTAVALPLVVDLTP